MTSSDLRLDLEFDLGSASEDSRKLPAVSHLLAILILDMGPCYAGKTLTPCFRQNLELNKQNHCIGDGDLS